MSLFPLVADGRVTAVLSGAVVVGYAVTLAVQVRLRHRVDLVPLLWAFLLATVFAGLLEFTTGLADAITLYEKASEEARQAMWAYGKGRGLRPLQGMALVAAVQSLLNGVVHVVVRRYHQPSP